MLPWLAKWGKLYSVIPLESANPCYCPSKWLNKYTALKEPNLVFKNWDSKWVKNYPTKHPKCANGAFQSIVMMLTKRMPSQLKNILEHTLSLYYELELEREISLLTTTTDQDVYVLVRILTILWVPLGCWAQHWGWQPAQEGCRDPHLVRPC